MKKYLLLSLLSFLYIGIAAQVPQGINYQAVAINSSGLPISNATIQVNAIILSDPDAQVVIWDELHSSVTTNPSGVINVVIGTGTKQSGSAASFDKIDWKVNPLYLKIRVYYQGAWKEMGTAKLWTVPHAMSAGTISGPLTKLIIAGDTDSNEEALFEVKNKSGQTVFAVYNEGVRIYVDDGAKSPKGGFAVGGFGTDKAPSQNLLFVSSDSIRAYIDSNSGKATKGGFAVGGFGTDKSGSQDLLRVTGDSTRIYVNDSDTKGVKGGFAIGGFDASKGLADNYVVINSDSTRFYLHEKAKGSSSTFNIVGINADNTRRLLMTANKDTVDIGAVLNVQNNLNVTGNIGYTGDVSMIVPSVYIMEPSNITETSVMIMTEVMGDGGSPILDRGVVWSTLPKPTVALPTRTSEGTAQGMLMSNITGLTPGTTYYVRAYATNANGTGYSNEVTVTTPLAGSTITDADGNVYNTVLIGTQTWMAQNLKTTLYNDATEIPCVKSDVTWTGYAAGAFTWYMNDSLTYADYGILYNWNAVNTGKLCPSGWHVPTEAEWNTLATFVGGLTVAGGMLKETDYTHWTSPNTDATNLYGFTGLPGGFRDNTGVFAGISTTGNWWSTTMISVDAVSINMSYNFSSITSGQSPSGMGMSVRCLKD